MNRKEKCLSADPDMNNVEDLETGGNQLPHSDRGSDQEEQMEIVNECDERVETDDDDFDERGRPQRNRRPPNRYGDWLLSSIGPVRRLGPAIGTQLRKLKRRITH